MLCFAVNAYKDWERDYARFEAAISQHSLQVYECAQEGNEIVITVIAKTLKQNDLTIELAKQHFGKAYAGLIT